jgi:hypothetical protein
MEEKDFTIQPLPIEAQFAPIQAILIEDLDGDGILDLLLGGKYDSRFALLRFSRF